MSIGTRPVHGLLPPGNPSLHDPLDGVVVVQAGLFQGGGVAGIGRKARIGVDLQDPRLAGLIDAEVNPHVAPQAEQPPTFQGQPLQLLDQGAVVLVEVETSRRVVVFEGSFVPLGPMADNPRLVGREGGEVHLADRQDLRPVGTVEHRQVEFAAVDELLRRNGAGPSGR